MAEPYWATPEQWALLEDTATSCMSACILELRARVEALEANSKPTPNPSQIRSSAPASSLVERVAIACAKPCNETWDDQARAAIREVTAALIEWDDSDQLIRTASDVANWLEQEAER